VTDGVQCGLGTVLEAEFAEDVRDVALDRPLAHDEGSRDLLVAATVSEQAENLAFALGELRAGFRFSGAGDLLHQATRDFWMQLSLACARTADGSCEV
jgi:hypothetical protein